MASKLSYASTPVMGDVIYESIPSRLRTLAEQDGDREACVYYDRNWTRRAMSRKELRGRSFSLAKTLIKNGLRNKATVGFCMSNSINSLVANMAVVCAGGIPFYMGNNLKDGSDMISVMNAMQCEMFIVDTDAGGANWNILENIWPENNTQSDAVPTLKTIICNGNISVRTANRLSLATLMASKSEDEVKLPDVQSEDVLVYFCTSGSTGKPKIVTYTHFNMLNFTRQLANDYNITDNSRFFCDRTFSWIGGYPRIFLSDGATRVFVDPSLTASASNIEGICDVISSERCDVVYCPNYIAVDLLQNQSLSTKFQHVEIMICSGERFPASYTGLKGVFCKTLVPLYGATEVGTTTTFRSPDSSRYDEGIIGTPIGGVEVKIIDQTGQVVPRGTPGELCVRSPWRCIGYLGDEATFRTVLDNANWFHTGDIAFVRPDGNLVMAGRQKEMISVQTNKIFPWSIEQTLRKMAGVVHAFAVGVPHKRSHEVICACVVPQQGVSITSADVKHFCDEVFLEESSAMVVTTKPAYHVVLESVPLTESGKVDRVRISRLAREQLQL